jgi:hypothetical protein
MASGRIINPAVPNLPLGTEEYERRYQDQFTNILRLYFNQLRNAMSELFSSDGGKYISYPYGAFSSDQDQIATANTATLMTFNTTDFSNSVRINDSKITVTGPGIYNLQFSAQFQNIDTQLHDVYIWLKQNGADITGSTGFVSIPNSHGGTAGHSIIGWNYFLSMAANDYVEIYWSPTDTDVTIQHLAASGTPTKPSTQSVVATLSFVSALPT